MLLSLVDDVSCQDVVQVAATLVHVVAAIADTCVVATTCAHFEVDCQQTAELLSLGVDVLTYNRMDPA